MPTNSATEIDLTCRSSYQLRSNKCCPDICLSCYAYNASYSSGLCTCNSGYYSKDNFANSDNCVAYSSGCTTCTSTTCSICSNANASPSRSICIAQNSINAIIGNKRNYKSSNIYPFEYLNFWLKFILANFF